VDRHYGAPDDEIANVLINLPDRAQRRRIRAAAEAALKHLGYRIAPQIGFDVHDVRPDPTAASAHEAVRVLQRFDGLT
jgi:hypothetical protein